MKSKSPAFQFYVTEYIGSLRVQMLSLEAEGAYIRLICFCWQHGSIPSNPREISKLVGKGCSTTLARVVAGMFERHPSDSTKLVHERLEKEKSKQAAWKEKCSAGGKKSAESKKSDSRVVELTLQQPLQDSTHTPSSSLSSSSSFAEREREFPETPPMSRKDFDAMAEMRAVPKDCAEWFWNTHDARNWLDTAGHPIRKVEPLLLNAKKNWSAKRFSPQTPIKKKHTHVLDADFDSTKGSK